MLPARISLTLSRHFSLSFITSGWSLGLHPVSSQSCCMYVRAGRPAFAWPYVGVHRSTSLMSSSLLLQQCPACLVCLTWIVFGMGGRWPYSWCFVGWCLQDLFNIARSILICSIENPNGTNKKEIYYFHGCCWLFQEEQKGYCWGTKRNKLLNIYIDHHILKEAKTRQENVDMAWIDDKTVYAKVPQTWMIEYLKMYKISDKIINLIMNAMENWQVESRAGITNWA